MGLSAPEKREAPPAPSDERPGLAVRLVAGKLLGAVVDARTSLDGLLDPAGGHPGFRALDDRDRNLVRAILLAALRHRGTIERLIAERLERPLPGNALALRHLLHVAATQILYLDVPDSAPLGLPHAAAEADPRSRRFKGLANAILRRLAREKAAVAIKAGENLPAWLREPLASAYGAEAAAAIGAAHAVPPPLDLTVKADPSAWAERLGGVVVGCGTVRLATLDGPLTGLPGFGEGEWWAQDAASALPARLMRDVRGRRVADLCAAPGGKTAQLCAAGARVSAFDQSRNRMRRLEENLARLKLAAETTVADIGALEPPSELFDAVLLDAPCSSTGTIRRHPDVAFTKDMGEVEKLSGVQARLLAHAARWVKPGGTLVFSNCSLLPEEGEAVATAFLADHPEFRVDPVLGDEVPGLDEAIDGRGFLRTLPSMLPNAENPRLAGLDGFFAARFRRAS